MSADDMLAAQLWPWPDPIIKRNSQGGVLFVNAAFLQIYGGQVTDWHGCAVEGWPAPQAGHVPNRFETRIPSNTGEIIYDWLEYVMADGGALAISRNVTALLNQSPPSDPALAPMPPMADPMADMTTTAPAMDTLPVHTQNHHTPQAHVPDVQPAEPQSVNLDPSIEAAIDVASETDFMAETQNISASDIEVSAEYAPAQEIAAPPVDIPVPSTPQLEEAAQTPRDYERRALPIENEESILGSNWRDAVIAKAVGSEVADTVKDDVSSAPVQQDQSPIEAPASQLAASPNDNDGAIRILLAEDNAINALLTRTLLEADGCYVDVVEDGSLAVDAMRVNKYDMILMDMRMPNMDGLESTRKIRTLSNEAKAIPIVALTANAFDDDRNACFDAGMNDFMTKPVSAEELQQMVQTWTKKSEVVAA